MKRITSYLLVIAFAAFYIVVPLSHQASAEGVTLQRMTDTLYAVIQAHRTTYARLIVNRLDNEEDIIEANEHWEEEQALLLPAQMFRKTAELVQEDKGLGVSYSLLSLWPINSKNKAKTDAEKKGLQFITKNQGKNYYDKEELGGKKYFTAVYPDIAVSKACIDCHNDHKDTPKKDFKLKDIMGGIVIRILLDAQ